MAFFGTEFVLDGVPSTAYNLFISNMNGGDLDLVPASSTLEIYEDFVYRKSKPYYYGAAQNQVLEFTLEITSPDPMDVRTASVAKKWLFGRLERKQLQIVQNDFTDVYFNCHLVEPEEMKVGNKIHGFSCTVHCDSPFAWEYERTLTKTYSDDEIFDEFYFYNDSDDDDYLYPKIQVTINASGGTFSILNITESRTLTFTDLQANEVITLDNNRNILTSSSGLLRMSNFNKTWMRFIQGANQIRITGNVASAVFTYQFARKVGT